MHTEYRLANCTAVKRASTPLIIIILILIVQISHQQVVKPYIVRIRNLARSVEVQTRGVTLGPSSNFRSGGGEEI